METMEDLTLDALSDPDYAVPIIRAYLVGGGILSSGWAMALVNEIDRLYNDIETNVDDERTHAAALCEAWGDYWATLYTSKLAPHQMSMMGWALAEKIKAHEDLGIVKAAREQLAIERMPKRRKKL